jgi:hypothetical protein
MISVLYSKRMPKLLKSRMTVQLLNKPLTSQTFVVSKKSCRWKLSMLLELLQKYQRKRQFNSAVANRKSESTWPLLMTPTAQSVSLCGVTCVNVAVKNNCLTYLQLREPEFQSLEAKVSTQLMTIPSFTWTWSTRGVTNLENGTKISWKVESKIH